MCGYREIPHRDFPWGSMVRVGGAKNVFRGTMPGFTGGEQVAVKVLVPAAERLALRREDFRRVVSLMARCHHPNVMRLLSVSCDDRFCLVMPLMREGSLDKLMRGCSYPCASVRVRYARGIFEGLAFLHCSRPPIIHRCISADNVFLSGDRAILSDIGIYPRYALEMRRDQAFDVRGAGVVIFQLLSWLREPERALESWERGPAEVADGSIQWPAEVPGVLHREAQECCDKVVANRPSSATVRGRLAQLDAYLTRDECLICGKRPRQVVLHPCRHNVVCLDCFGNMNPGHACPLCLRVVSSSGSALALLGWALEKQLPPEAPRGASGGPAT